MITKRFFSLLFTALIATAAHGATNEEPAVTVIPQPVKMTVEKGHFNLKPSTAVILGFEDEKMECATDFLNEVAEPIFGTKLKVATGKTKKGAINITRDESLGEEAYRLEVGNKGINIEASTSHGVFYAFQTLRQLIPVEMLKSGNAKSVEIPAVAIEDKPHFWYRGVMFDICRHFFTVDQVKEVIDMAAMHKMNRLHWHLTEDQGWRIEIKKYPKLTEIGSVREDSQVPGTHHQVNCKMEGKPYGPYFYTQDQIREVVKYAADRFITVVPEIEIPGHSVAALAAYPELGCTGEQYKVRTIWGISEEVACPGKESTFKFWEDVLSEVLDLFPSEYIHIGGDECPRVAWEKCPACQARIKAEGLQNEDELQTYVNHRIEKFLNDHGRKMIGWDEILKGGVSPTTTVMSWRGSKGGIAAAKAGNTVIMTPNTHCYLDYPQGKDKTIEPPFGERRPDRPHYLPLEKVYALDPYDQLTEDEQKYVIGVQGNLWTEHIATFDHVQYMLLPRMVAIAEVGWNYEGKDFDRFTTNMKRMLKLYDAYGYKYAVSYWRENGKL